MISIYLIAFQIIFFASVSYASDRDLYIMLNVDNTILDRLYPCDENSKVELKNAGFDVQILEFVADENSSPKFLKIYESLARGGKAFGETDFVSKIVSKRLAKNKFAIRECIVIRPSILYLLKELKKLNAHILLTSRNDDARTKNLQENLNLIVDYKKFSEIVTFIPRDWFRVKLSMTNGEELTVKSAKKIREMYKMIKDNDIIILLDHIGNERFVKGEKDDLSIKVSKFIIDNPYDQQFDDQEISDIITTIKKAYNPRVLK